MNKIAADTEHYYFIVAQNDRNGEIEIDKGSDSTTDDEPGQATEAEKQPPKQKRKADPLQSFEPTEKVKAETVKAETVNERVSSSSSSSRCNSSSSSRG